MIHVDTNQMNSMIDLSRATSGVIDNQFRTGYKIRVSWTVNSQNIANNTSNVTVHAQLISTGGGYTINSTATKNGSLTINGATYNFTFKASLSGNQTKTVFSKTVDVVHDSNGTKTCLMSTSLGINVTLSGVYWGTVTASGSGSFNTIPRTSSFSMNTRNGTIGSTKFTININRASTAFTHKVYYKFGSINWLATSDAATTFSFTPNISDCSQLPSSTSGVATIVVETWSGGTYIGSDSTTITLNVPDSVKPTFSNLSSEIVSNGANTSYGYIKGKSKSKLTINGASGSYSSWITGYYISGGGFSTSSQQFTTGPLNSAGSVTFSAYVVDSRGRRSDTKNVTINVQDYFTPIIEYLSTYRCTAEGSPSDEGTHIKVSFEYNHSSNISGNTVTNKVEYKAVSSSTWINAGSVSSPRGITIGDGGISTSSSYNVRITLSDKFETVSTIRNVSPAFVTLDFKKGGKGIAIGKTSERDNLFEVAMNFNASSDTLKLGKGIFGTQDDGISTTESSLSLGSSNQIWLKANNYYDGSSDKQYTSGRGSSQLLVRGNEYPKFRWNSDVDGSGNISWTGFYDILTTYQPQLDSVTVGSTKQWKSNGFGESYLTTGNGDAANYDSHNVILKTWYGLGIRDYQNICRIVFNARTGDINVKGNIGVKDGQRVMSHYWDGDFWRMTTDGDVNAWIKTTGNGIIPAWADAGNGASSVGVTGYPFQSMAVRYLNSPRSGNLDLQFNSGTGFLNVYAGSGAGIIIGRPWSGSSGTEPCLYNSKGGGWGFLGNSGTSFFRIYGSGGSVSDRDKKYNITKADDELQYEHIKNLNIYNYRSISTVDTDIRELAEKYLTHSKFRDMDKNYTTSSLEIDGIVYDELDSELTQEEIEELRIQEIIKKNPHFSKVKRQDLMLGAMVDELPTEVTFYDNEGGDGKAVDMYSYTTMIAGATKHLINKVEYLEKENEELKNKVNKMEELLNGIINKG